MDPVLRRALQAFRKRLARIEDQQVEDHGLLRSARKLRAQLGLSGGGPVRATAKHTAPTAEPTAATKRQLAELQQILAKVTGRKPSKLRLTTEWAALGLGSLELFELLDRLEHRYKRRIPESVAIEARTVGDLLRMLSKRARAT